MTFVTLRGIERQQNNQFTYFTRKNIYMSFKFQYREVFPKQIHLGYNVESYPGPSYGLLDTHNKTIFYCLLLSSPKINLL